MIDIIISGAGLVGTSVALALEQAGFQVVLFDAKPRLTNDTASDLRTVALSLTSVEWLKKIAVWAALPEKHRASFTNMCVFESNDKAPELAFSAQSAGKACLGYIVSHDQLLLTAQSMLKNPVYFNSRIDTLTQMDNHVAVSSGEQKFEARLLIGCDGGDSFLRQTLDLTHQVHEYHQHALVAELHCEKWHEHTAWQSFSKDAVMGLLPLYDRHRVNMVWSLNSDVANECATMSHSSLQLLIQKMFGHRLGTLEIVSSHVGRFPLMARHAHEYGLGRVILLGDAIHTVHPLAGQGVNLGFLDAQALFDSLKETPHAQWNIPTLLAAFERKRKAHNFLMMHLMTALQKFYSQAGWMENARHLGIKFFNMFPFIKSLIIRMV